MTLTAAQFAILLALTQGEMHGYGIMKASAGDAARGPGTVYRSIKQLVGAGLVVEIGDRVEPDAADDQRRRYYRLTQAGRQAAEAEALRLARLVERARRGA